LFPFTINALGPAEVAIAYFFKLIGIHPTLAVLISVSSNVISSVIPGMIGFFLIVTSRTNTSKHNAEENV
jgi:uncharacterized membrane protein YbhN (UPF0104 family)